MVINSYFFNFTSQHDCQLILLRRASGLTGIQWVAVPIQGRMAFVSHHWFRYNVRFESESYYRYLTRNIKFVRIAVKSKLITTGFYMNINTADQVKSQQKPFKHNVFVFF
jgi:hypothetical protein